MERQTYDAIEVASILGLSPSAVYRACREGDLPAVKIGRRWLIGRAALDWLLAEGLERIAAKRRQNCRRQRFAAGATETFAEELRRKLDMPYKNPS